MDVFHSEAFSSKIKKLMEENHVPGFSIAIVHGDKVASAGYGYADVELSKPCTADTLFDIASSSKSLTAAAVALLTDDDEKYPEVRYEAIVSHLLPDDFVMPKPKYTESVTVEDILSHRSGMPRHDLSYFGQQASRPDNLRSVTRNLRNLAVAAPLRVKYMYCNMMYTVAAHLIEVKAQQSFSSFLEERFFQPLGMESTSVQPSRARAKGFGERMAKGHYWDKEKSTNCGFEAPECPEGEGAGSISTSANDFIKWAKALLRNEGPISKEVYEGLVRLRTITNPDAKGLEPFESPVFYTAGLEVYYYRGHTVVGHDGMITGFQSLFFFLPELDLGVVMFSNSADADPIHSFVRRELIDAVLRERGEFPAESLSLNEKEKDKKSEEPEKKKDEEPQPQVTPLNAYVGTYWNPGYHSFTVQLKDEKLFIDAGDRSFGSTLTFEHKSDQTKYIAHLRDNYEGEDEELRAEFVFEGDRAMKLGILIEPELKDELIWFSRSEGDA
ncbi:beta-lactamase family protein [Daldinia caldariorum]|uniref:beta-lactamase family protein n=1 Tax=Daldinia caldariorum TaxID=326644 RepID=UPI0020086C54|nr:beta-lactamase family protein [Daldinia caldariorum]KAI1464322.1 beta-lactamase family protein [Daldinia caldariorum]